jgi:hypothetical protein
VAEHTEVKTKLTLDDAASTALHHIREGFADVGEKVKEVGHELVSMAKQAAAVAIGFQLSGMIDSFKELGHELVEGATHLENQKKELAGVISLAEKGDMSMEELGERAGQLNERFEMLGITAGVSKDSLVDMFEMMASRSTRGSAAAADMAEQMAIAARVLPGGADAMAAAWRDLESGIVRPKNALVMLMRQTGVAAGTSKQIAKGLSALFTAGKQEKAMQMAEQAISRMAEKMRHVPPTFEQVLTSLKGFREMFIETMGTPILRQIVPQFERLKQYLIGHREEIEKLAHTMGEKVGEWVSRAAEMIRDAFMYLQSHSQEIFEALEGGAKAIKDAVSFMVTHRQLLLGLAAANFVGGAVGGEGGKAAKLAGSLPQIGTALGEGLKKALNQKTFGVQMGLGGMALGAGAGIAAVAAWRGAFEQAAVLEKESGLTTLQTMKHLLHIGGGLSTASNRIMNFGSVLGRFAEDSANIDASGDDLEQLADKIGRLGRAAVAAGDMTQEALDKTMRATNERLETETKLRGALDQMRDSNVEAASGPLGSIDPMHHYMEAFAAANEGHAKEAVLQAHRMSDAMRIAIAGPMGTIDDAIKKLQAYATGKTDGEFKPPQINFGPTTMNIKQDFRDQDPDRIAIVFRKDIAKNAASRVSARTATPFGY